MRLEGPEYGRLHRLTCNAFDSVSRLRDFVRDHGLTEQSAHILFGEHDNLETASRRVLDRLNEQGRMRDFLRTLRAARPQVAAIQAFVARHSTGAERTLETLLPRLDQAAQELEPRRVIACAERALPTGADPLEEDTDSPAVALACELAVFPAGVDGVYPLQHFVSLLKAEAPAGVRVGLDEWLEESVVTLAGGNAGAVRLRLAHVAADDAAQQAAPEPSVLLVRVRHDSAARCMVDAWLFQYQRPTQRIGSTMTVSEAEVAATVMSLCGEASRSVLHGSLLVELMLPRRLLVQPVENWSSDDGFELCMDFPVVVRPLERWSGDQRQIRRLTDHWRTINDATRFRITGELPPGAEHTAYWHGEMTCRPQHAKVLALNLAMVCAVLAAAPEEQVKPGDALQALLAAGLPVIVWLRSCPDDAGRQRLREVLEDAEVRGLTASVHALRTDGLLSDDWHVGRHLTLVWDDPTREPPQHQLENPGDE